MSLPQIYYIDGHSATNENTRQELARGATNLRGLWSLKPNQYVIFPQACGNPAYGYISDDQLARLFRNKRRTLQWANGMYTPSRRFAFNYAPTLYRPGQHPPNPIISTVGTDISTMGLWKFGRVSEVYPSGRIRTEYRYHNLRNVGVTKRLSEFIGSKPGIFFVGVCRDPLNNARPNAAARIRENEERHRRQLTTKRKRA